MRRSRLPRWARGVRPKVIKAPAPPSLLTLVKQDKDWELQQRICTNPVVLCEVVDTGDFWDKQWPRLLRQASENKSQACLRLLCSLKEKGKGELPPLPAHALGWVLKGMEQSGERLSGLDGPTQEVVLPRLAQSPIAFRPEDGLRIMAMGGLSSALYISDGPRRGMPDMENLPAVENAWKKWCASKTNVAAGLALLETPNGGMTSSRLKPFVEMLEALPASRLPEALNTLCDHLLRSSWSVPKGADRRMGLWLEWFSKKDFALDHPVWARWGSGLCRLLESANAARPEVANDWTSVLLYNVPSTGPLPPGWSWNDRMAAGLFSARANVVTKVLLDHDDKQWIGSQPMAQAGTWLRETMDTWDRLKEANLVDATAAHQWNAALAVAMGEDWQARMQAFVDAHADNEDAQGLRKHWARWRARELSAVLDQELPFGQDKRKPRM